MRGGGEGIQRSLICITRCSTSLIIKEIQLKMYLYTIFLHQTGKTKQVWEHNLLLRLWREGTLKHYCGNTKWYYSYPLHGRNLVTQIKISIKIIKLLTLWPTSRNVLHKWVRTRPRAFIHYSIVLITTEWKQPKYPSREGQLNNQCYT